jgi:hypothetical protein
MLQVPEQYAGQLMKCPLCAGTFTVPALPQAPAPPPVQAVQPTPSAPAPAATPAAAANKQKAPGNDKASAQGPAPAPAASTPSGYARTRSYTLNPRVLAWLTPLSLVAVFLLMFFSWIGMYPSGYGGVTQSGWGVAFDVPVVDPTWKTINSKDAEEIEKGVGVSAFVIFFALLLIPTLLLSVVTTLMHLKVAPLPVPPALETFWPWRPLAIAALTLIAFIFLMLQVVSSFPLESKAKALAVEKMRKEVTDESTRKQDYLDIITGQKYGAFALERSFTIHLVLLFLLVALVASLLDGWVTRRGNQPVPRMDLHC